MKLFANQQGVQLDSRQQQRARDVEVAFILRDIVKAAEAQGKKSLKQQKKKSFLDKRLDGRKYNRGVSRRFCRSYEFKKKVVKDYERLLEQHPSLVGHISSMVADLHDVSLQQVNLWLRDKHNICEKAKGKYRHLTSKTKRQGGIFPEAEAAVYKEFQESRKKGRQVGPKRLKQAMAREVRKLRDSPDATEHQKIAAALFHGKAGWLRRFCKRFAIVLRRKTNVKKVPIHVRLGKIKRWFAIYWMHLLSFKATAKCMGSTNPKTDGALTKFQPGCSTQNRLMKIVELAGFT